MQRVFAYVFIGSLLYAGTILNLCIGAEQSQPQQPRRSTEVQIETPRAGVHIKSEVDKSRELGIELSSPAINHAAIIRVKDLIGLNVHGTNNEDLGRVEDFVIDISKGNIRYGVLSFGGFLGMGEKLFAVPWEDLKLNPEGMTSVGTEKVSHFTLAVNKDALKNAPGFNKESWPNLADPNWSLNIDKFYSDQRRASKERSKMR